MGERLITVNRRLGLSGRRIATTAGGAPCCCGGNTCSMCPPVLQGCDGPLTTRPDTARSYAESIPTLYLNCDQDIEFCTGPTSNGYPRSVEQVGKVGSTLGSFPLNRVVRIWDDETRVAIGSDVAVSFTFQLMTDGNRDTPASPNGPPITLDFYWIADITLLDTTRPPVPPEYLVNGQVFGAFCETYESTPIENQKLQSIMLIATYESTLQAQIDNPDFGITTPRPIEDALDFGSVSPGPPTLLNILPADGSGISAFNSGQGVRFFGPISPQVDRIISTSDLSDMRTLRPDLFQNPEIPIGSIVYGPDNVRREESWTSEEIRLFGESANIAVTPADGPRNVFTCLRYPIEDLEIFAYSPEREGDFAPDTVVNSAQCGNAVDVPFEWQVVSFSNSPVLIVTPGDLSVTCTPGEYTEPEQSAEDFI